MLTQKEKKVIEKSFGTLLPGDFGQDAVADAIKEFSLLNAQLSGFLAGTVSSEELTKAMVNASFSMEKLKLAVGISDSYVSDAIHRLVIAQDKANIERVQRLRGNR